MNIVLSFIGELPVYIKYCLYQIRLFFDGDIYLIIDDLQSPIINDIILYNIKIIPYSGVISKEFLEFYGQHKDTIVEFPQCGTRSKLLMRAFERFFLLHNLMEQHNLINIFFMEIDNLIYDNPNNWSEQFSKKGMCYMYDNEDRFATGVCYFKNVSYLKSFLDSIYMYVSKYPDCYHEMAVLADHYKSENNNDILILPTHSGDTSKNPIFHKNNGKLNPLTYVNFQLFSNSVFDAAAMGIWLFGIDPVHTGGKILPKTKGPHFSHIEYSEYEFKWETDSNGRNIPFINFGNGEWIHINNLHIHSKELQNGLSKLFTS